MTRKKNTQKNLIGTSITAALAPIRALAPQITFFYEPAIKNLKKWPILAILLMS